MYRAGTAVIAGDADLQERYYAVIHKDESREGRNPLVQILAVIDYPRQTAIIFPDVANENMPIEAGRICRMRVDQVLEGYELPDYEQSRQEALDRAIMAARADHRQDVLEILIRHKQGVFRRSRRLCDK